MQEGANICGLNLYIISYYIVSENFLSASYRTRVALSVAAPRKQECLQTTKGIIVQSAVGLEVTVDGGDFGRS